MLCYHCCKYQKRRWRHVSITARVLKLYKWPSYMLIYNRDIFLISWRSSLTWTCVLVQSLKSQQKNAQNLFSYVFQPKWNLTFTYPVSKHRKIWTHLLRYMKPIRLLWWHFPPLVGKPCVWVVSFILLQKSSNVKLIYSIRVKHKQSVNVID